MALSHKVNRFSLGSSSNIDKKLDIDLVTKHLKKDNATSSSKINSDKQKNEEEKDVQKNEEKEVQAESTENKPEQAKVENNSDVNAKENEVAQSSKKKPESRGVPSNCDLCDKTFPSKISLKRHKMVVHKDSKYYPYNAIEIVSTPGKSENQTTKTNLKENISNNSTTDNAKSPGRNKRKTM